MFTHSPQQHHHLPHCRSHRILTTTNHSQDAYISHSSRTVGPQDYRDTILPLNLAYQHWVRVLSSPLSSSTQASTPSKQKLDKDDDDDASVTSSQVPLSLYYMPQQTLSKGLSKPHEASLPMRGPPSSRVANKRCCYSPPWLPHSLLHPVTPAQHRGIEEVVPTSQHNNVGLYSPSHPNTSPQCKSAVHENVENWRHGRSTYRSKNVSPLRFLPKGNYSIPSTLNPPMLPRLLQLPPPVCHVHRGLLSFPHAPEEEGGCAANGICMHNPLPPALLCLVCPPPQPPTLVLV